MDRALPTQANIWPTEDKSYNIWPDVDEPDDVEEPDDDDVGSDEVEIFRILQSTLRADNASPEARAERIVKDIYFILTTEREIDGRQQPVYDDWCLWDLSWSIIKCLPYDHLYSEILNQAWVTIDKADQEMKSADGVSRDKKVNISTLHFSLREKHDSFCQPFRNSDLKLWSIHWKNFASFLARLIDKGFRAYGFALWIIRGTLEDALSTDTSYKFHNYVDLELLDTNLWVASEMIFYSGKVLYTALTTEYATMDDAHSCQTHPLCSEIPPFSLERWQFWQKRFIEFAALAETYQLDSNMVARLTEIVRHMDIIQQEGA